MDAKRLIEKDGLAALLMITSVGVHTTCFFHVSFTFGFISLRREMVGSLMDTLDGSLIASMGGFCVCH